MYNANEYYGWRNFSEYKSCNSSAIFAHILQNEDFSGKKSFYIVIDHFQRLYQIQQNLLSSLIQITEIESLYKATESKIGFILIDDSSAMINIKQILGTKHTTAFPVYFQQYDNKQLQSILYDSSKHLFGNISSNDIKLIIKQLVNSFNFESRRIDRFHQYLALLMPDIIKLITKQNKTKNKYITDNDRENENEEKDEEWTEMAMDVDITTSGSNNIESISNLANKLILSLHERVSKSQHLSMDYISMSSLNLPFKQERREPDLPYASKLLLLSGYLASYNNRKWNRYQFADIQTRRSRKRRAAPRNANSEYSLREKGPQQWTLRDLSGIFIELFRRESPAEYNRDLKHIHDIHSQIAHLISLSFISITSREGTLDDIKFKCNIDHDFAKFIADKIGIKTWANYLED